MYKPVTLTYSKANVARVYNHFLGGKDAVAADRELARKLEAVYPNLRKTVLANRAFLGRVVRYLVAERGVRQFLDIGSGLPTQQNVHEVAQGLDPTSRIVYVDNDPVAVSHADALMANHNPNVGVVHGDLRDPGHIFAAKATQALIDWDQPVAVLMVAVLHCIRNTDNPYDALARYVNRLPHGGFLALSHGLDVPGTGEMAQMYAEQALAAQARNEEEIGRFFTGLELVEPGLVRVSSWRPSVSLAGSGKRGTDGEVWWLGGIGEKR